MSDSGHTTIRDEARPGRPASRLALRWVWPRERTVILSGTRTVIGRGDSCSLKIDGPGVSRQHAELTRQGPLYVLRDLGSTNGTRHSGKRIDEAPIRLGSVLRIGPWVGVVCAEPIVDAPFGEVSPGLFGGPEIAALIEPLRRGARAGLNVLLVGRTGTGKERVANAVHHLSGRSGPFFPVNCAAIPEQLAEAELFGYRKGAFTGAERAGTGYFRAANAGTLFLDEVAELPLPLQAKLLRVLEDRRVMGLGEVGGVEVDVQVVAAVQRPIHDLVEQGKLREDLAARLSGLVVDLPALAERRGDILPLFRHFLEKHTAQPPRLDADVIEALCVYGWPQNVRELEATTRALAALHGDRESIELEHLPPRFGELLEDDGEVPAAPRPKRNPEQELQAVRDELARNGGNIKAAAAALGIARQRIYRLLNTSKQVASPNSDIPSE